MRTLSTAILAAALLALLAAPAFAQRRPGGGGGFQMGSAQLLQNKGVQEELKLTKDQKDKVKKANEDVRAKYADDFKKAREDNDREKMGELFRKMNEDTTKEVNKVLDAGQAKRLKQIRLQVSLQFTGPGVFLRPEVEKELKLTDKQKGDIKEATEELNKDRRELLKDIPRDDREKRAEAMKKSQELTQKTLSKVTSALTDDQKKTWKEMTGEKFELKLEGRPGGGRPGGRRPGGGRPEPKKDI